MATNPAELYERDFHAWALTQADELRRLAETRPNAALDFERLIDEVEGLARSELNTVLSQLTRLIHHLLKLEHSPSPAPRRQWLNTVDDARDEIGRHMTASMRPTIEAALPAIYRSARRAAERDLLDHHEVQAAGGLQITNPYPLDHLIDAGWLPASRCRLADQ